MSTVNQHIDGNGNIFSGTGDVRVDHLEQHYHAAAPPPIPNQRPTLEPCFLHREDELVWLKDRLHPGKVAAVCGPGGMGKSALAAQAVHQLDAARFPDGIIFHSFYHQPKVETALQAICAAYQVEAKAGLETAVRNALSDRKALLILDGTEQADDLQALLRLRGACGVLITSRKRTDALADRLDLKPLDEQPAAEVFRLYSGVAADDAGVAGICKLLGGWPVALRIAGRYLSTTGESAAAYLKWLEKEPFKELAGGQHQEENAALLLRRSVDAVSGDARQALSLFGVLAFEPVARASVAAVLDENIRCCRLALNELVNYGLLEKREERWQISHALVHTYARTELAMSKESLERLAGWYIAFCKAASEEGVKGYALLDGERAHCLRLIESCLASKLWQEVKLLVWAIDIYLERQGHWTEWQTAVSTNLTAARQGGDRREEGWSLNELGCICKRRGDYAQALSYYKQSLPIRQEVGDKFGEGKTQNNIATIYRQQGEYKQALNHHEQSLTIQQEIGDQEGEGWTLNDIGLLYRMQGDNKTALQYYKRCLPIRREVGDEIGKGATLNNIAAIYCTQGDYVKAIEYREQTLAIRRELGDRAGETLTCWNIGRTYEYQGDFAKAEEYMSQAVQIAEEIGYPSLEKYREGLKRVRAARRA